MDCSSSRPSRCRNPAAGFCTPTPDCCHDGRPVVRAFWNSNAEINTEFWAMTTLKGKTLFISGGSRGIGLAIALRAARDGANVAIAAKTTEPHPKLKGTIYTAADDIRAAGGKALPILCDIREEAQVMAAIDKTAAEFA